MFRPTNIFNHSSFTTLAQTYPLYPRLWAGSSHNMHKWEVLKTPGKSMQKQWTESITSPAYYNQINNRRVTHVKKLLSSDWNVFWTMVWMQHPPRQAQTITLCFPAHTISVCMVANAEVALYCTTFNIIHDSNHWRTLVVWYVQQA